MRKNSLLICFLISAIVMFSGGGGAVCAEAAQGFVPDRFSELRDLTNLFENPGFESVWGEKGVPNSWLFDWQPGLTTITGEGVFRGERSALVNKKPTASGLYYQMLSVQQDKTYIASSMVRGSVADTNVVMYVGNNSIVTLQNTETTNLSLTDKWQRNSIVFRTDKGTAGKVWPTTTCWAVDKAFYADDYYLGELMVADIDCSAVPTETVIPKDGEGNREIALNAVALNQLGTTDGLAADAAGIEQAPVSWSLTGAKDGVSISEGKLIVTDMAAEGEITLKASCTPVFLGAAEQTEDIYLNGREKEVTIHLAANDYTLPRAKNVSVTGTVKAGETLELQYDYAQVNGIAEGDSLFQWYYKENIADDYQEIPGATGKSYVVGAQYADYYITARVTPVAANGVSGETRESQLLMRPVAPVAENVKIAGEKLAIGGILTVSYDYADRNDFGVPNEGETEVAWLRADSVKGSYQVIDGENKPFYEIKAEDVGKYIRAEVTPVSTEEPCIGETVPSEPVLAAAKPAAQNVSIRKISGYLLGAKFEYSHPTGIAQGESIYEWFAGSSLLHTGTTFDASEYKGDTITLRVTPVAMEKPFEGETASISYEVPSGKNSGGGGSGGGGSRYVSTPTVTPPEVKPEENPTDTPEEPEDLETYPEWAREAIRFVLDEGIMQNISPNQFAPDERMSRADFLCGIMAALGLKESAYRDEFSDVSTQHSFSGLLQTAVDCGIISKAERFYPERNVARDEACKILVEGLKCALGTDELRGTELSFADAGLIEEWALPYVRQAVGIRLLNGVSETEFAPRGNVTRAQTAVIALRITGYINAAQGER